MSKPNSLQKYSKKVFFISDPLPSTLCVSQLTVYRFRPSASSLNTRNNQPLTISLTVEQVSSWLWKPACRINHFAVNSSQSDVLSSYEEWLYKKVFSRPLDTSVILVFTHNAIKHKIFLATSILIIEVLITVTCYENSCRFSPSIFPSTLFFSWTNFTN